MTPYQNLEQAEKDIKLVRSLTRFRQESERKGNEELVIELENEIESILRRYSNSIPLPMVNSSWESLSSQYVNGTWLEKKECVSIVNVNVAKEIIVTMKVGCDQLSMSWKQFQNKFREVL